ncbi:MAG: SCO1664 family protein [Chloroflexi bacterium]|nr:SCO1664 family protein [Chloroflexota bacterium]
MRDCALAPVGSNYTFYAVLSDPDGNRARQTRVVYKPQRGEAPLWDFPDGTLYLREYAAYLLSEALAWGYVPPTVVRDGVHGVGSVQLYIESDPMANYFTLREKYHQEMLRLCVYDVIANNADRKASHCLLGNDGCIWAIDHGITFHSDPKLRTVIWDFAGEPVPEWVLVDLRRMMDRFQDPSGLQAQLLSVLRSDEVQAFRRRVESLLERPVFPFPGPRRAVPWPWI